MCIGRPIRWGRCIRIRICHCRRILGGELSLALFAFLSVAGDEVVGEHHTQDECDQPEEGCDCACKALTQQGHGCVAQPDDRECERGCADASPCEDGDCDAVVFVHVCYLSLFVTLCYREDVPPIPLMGGNPLNVSHRLSASTQSCSASSALS